MSTINFSYNTNTKDAGLVDCCVYVIMVSLFDRFLLITAVEHFRNEEFCFSLHNKINSLDIK